MSDLAYGLELLSGGQLIQTEGGWYTCRHTTLAMVRRVQKNGVLVCGKQCQVCGRFEQVPKGRIDIAALAEFSPDIWLTYQAASRALSDKDREVRRSEENRAWWGKYNAYLRTPEWRERRRKVFARAGGICECCLERAADQVHHTTYQHVGNEPLWELRAICEPCHEALTERDREARSA